MPERSSEQSSERLECRNLMKFFKIHDNESWSKCKILFIYASEWTKPIVVTSCDPKLKQKLEYNHKINKLFLRPRGWRKSAVAGCPNTIASMKIRNDASLRCQVLSNEASLRSTNVVSSSPIWLSPQIP